MTRLWVDRQYYQDVMSPDEEAEWAEHDRRCGHASELGTEIFSPTPALVRVSPSASGCLLSPWHPDAPSPLKEAA